MNEYFIKLALSYGLEEDVYGFTKYGDEYNQGIGLSQDTVYLWSGLGSWYDYGCPIKVNSFSELETIFKLVFMKEES
ncbi:hypothetical protein VPBG_00250 [Vibrio phage helene 12B3]|uniref:hypothetical protein n=1 Tax=Vibrio phage helene 12B3 TaxID=573173 RepID=UPI0002C07C86|nr:hypothetical protein VPBG_00250 [Vibrio phage helene 12B3]AGG58022.1 hypothetical protein VPBG_00250 [Vibrio phage helene 12B3]